jgi:hypothetical protein
MAQLPAILNAGQQLGDDPQPLATAFADALAAWYRDVGLPTAGAYFAFTVSLFINLTSGGAARQVPLLTLEKIDVDLPTGWPS